MTPIYALILRDLKRILRTKAQIASALVQPIVYFIIMGSGFNPIYQKAGSGNYLQFIAPGIVVTTMAFAAIYCGMTMILDREYGFLKGALVAPVSRLQIALGSVGGTVMVSSLQGLLMLAFCAGMGFRLTNTATLPFAFLFLLLTPLLFAALSTVIGATLQRVESFGVILNFVFLPIFLTSGAMFPTTGVPKFMSVLTMINPLSYGVDGLRASLNGGGSNFGILLDATVLASLSVMMICLAAWRVSKIEA